MLLTSNPDSLVTPGADVSWWCQEATAAANANGANSHLSVPRLSGSRSADVAIVGGGYTGLWTALALREREPGLRIDVYEAGTCGAGASGKNGGIVHGYWADLARLIPLLGVTGAREVADAGSRAQAALDRFAKNCPADVWWRPNGMLKVSTTVRQDAQLAALAEAGRLVGAEDKVVPISAEEVQQRCSSPRFRQGLLLPEAATVHPGRLIAALWSAAIAAGVNVFARSPILELVPGSPNLLVGASGTVHAEAVVLATNAALTGVRPTNRHLTNFGSSIVLTAPIEDALARIGWVGGEGISDSRMFLHYFRTTNDGRLAFGSGSGPIGLGGRLDATFVRDAPSARRAEMGIHRLLPGLGDPAVTHTWGGAIDVSADHLPFAGTVPGTRVHYACGYSGHGVNPTYIGGQALAGLALGVRDYWTELPFCTRRVPTLPPEPLRYAGGKMARAAILSCEDAEERGARGSWVARVGATVPAALGLKVGTR